MVCVTVIGPAKDARGEEQRISRGCSREFDEEFEGPRCLASGGKRIMTTTTTIMRRITLRGGEEVAPASVQPAHTSVASAGEIKTKFSLSELV